MLKHQDDISGYVDSLYSGDAYSEDDLNSIFGVLKNEKLISCYYADNRAWVTSITFTGKQYFDDKGEFNKEVMEKEPKIFISHSSKDKDFVEAFVELLNNVGLNQKHIFCSSLPGYDIRMDKDIFECLREQFDKYNLHVFVIHSKNYYDSPVSLNEMGAAWVLKNRCTSILLPGFDFSEMRGVVNSNTISLKLDREEREVQSKLNQIYDALISEFSLDRLDSIIWEQKRDRFISEINQLGTPSLDIEKNEYNETLSQTAEALLTKAEKTSDGVIMAIRTMSGPVFEIGQTEVEIPDGARGVARIEAAIEELVKGNYVTVRGKNGEILQITNKGYSYIDKKAGH